MNSYQIFKKIFKILNRRERLYSIVIAIFMIVAMIFEMLSVGSFLPLVGSLLDENYIPDALNKIGIKNFEITFNQMLIILLILFFIKNVYLVIFNILQKLFINLVSLRAMNQVYSYYLSQNYQFHLNRNSALLIRNINESGVVDGILLRVLSLINDVIVVFGLILLLIWAQPTFTLSTIAFILVAILIYNLFTKKKIKIWGKERFDTNYFLTKNLYEGISAFKEVILYNSSNFFIKQNYKIKKNLLNINYKFKIIEFLPKYIIEVLGILIVVVLIFFLMRTTNNPKDIMPILALYTASAFKIIPALLKIFSSFQNFNYLNPSLDNIYTQLEDYKLLNKKNNILKSNKEDITFENKIEIKNLNFEFSQKNIIIKNLNLVIKKNSFVGIKGASGSGKSTLLNILSGLIIPQSGSILVDGKDISNNIESLRKKIGYVSQSVFLLDSSIKNNIAFGVAENEIDFSKLSSAIKKSGLESYIHSLDKKIDTVVGERGLRISGGQKQRIGLARALYFSPEILILDEATNSLDKKTEKNILDQLVQIKNEITLLIVSHENKPLEITDKVYDLNEFKS